MTSTATRRLRVLACALAGTALVQGCAVTTGPFSPARSPINNASMTSRFDVAHQQSGGTRVFRMRTVNGTGGLFDYKYY